MNVTPTNTSTPDRVVINGVEYVRAALVPFAAQPTLPRQPNPRMVDRKCQWCKGPFKARAADVKRGWAKFCSKSCKAKKQESRTGQYRAISESERGEFSDAHLFSNEEHDCNKD